MDKFVDIYHNLKHLVEVEHGVFAMLSAWLDQYAAGYFAMTNDIIQAKKTVEDKKQASKRAYAEFRALEQTVESQHNAATRKLEEAKTRLAETTTRASDAQAKLNSLRAERAALLGTRDRSAELAQARQQVDEARRRVKALEAEAKATAAAIVAEQAERKSFEREIARRKSTVVCTADTCATLHGRVLVRRGIVSAVRKAIVEYRANLALTKNKNA